MPTASGGGMLCTTGWGTMTTMTTPALRATPPQRGTLARDSTYQVPLHWRGGRSPGWSESSRNRTYSPLSSRAKRGNPVNKKALRANARRHIALDCHSRTPTFSTLIVLLRNDRGRVDIIYTLNSTLYYCHAVRDNNITLRQRRINVPCITMNDAVILICRWVFRRWGVATSRNCPRRHKISTPHGWRVVNILNKQHYYYDSC